MITQTHQEQPLALSLAIALVIHVFLLLVFSLLIASAESSTSTSPEPPSPPLVDEIQLVFEPLPEPGSTPALQEIPPIVSPAKPSATAENTSSSADEPRFIYSEGNSENAPEKAAYYGQANSKASSGAKAITGNRTQTAQSGVTAPDQDVRTTESRFSEEQEDMPKPEEFIEPEIEDHLIETPQEAPETEDTTEIESTKTEVLGQLTVSGEGSQDIIATPEGHYKAEIKKIIVAIWLRNQQKYSATNAPGAVEFTFTILPNGRITNRKPPVRKGASDSQKGQILKDVASVKLPSHPKDLRRVLKGKGLTVTLKFSYN